MTERGWGQPAWRECGERGGGPSTGRFTNECPASAVRSAQATLGVGSEDGEQIEARQYGVDLQRQDSTGARGRRILQGHVRLVVSAEGSSGRHGEDQATDEHYRAGELGEAGAQRAPSPPVEFDTNLLQPTR